MIRYLYTFTRYIWLWLILLIIFPVIGTILISFTNTYTARASLWVEVPLFTDSQNQNNNWGDSPAKQTAGLLSELLNTREFVNGVIDNTSRKKTLKNDQDRLSAIDYITTKTKIEGDKTRLISLSFTDSKANLAVETLQAIITRFQSYYDERIKNQGDAAIAYYQQLVDRDKSDLDLATDDLKQFIEDHPNQVSKDLVGRATSPEDLEYGRLSQILEDARKRYDTDKSSLDRVTNSYDAYQQGQAVTFRVQDKPGILDVGTSKFRQIAIGGGAGIVIGLLCAIIGTILLTLSDSSIRFSYQAFEVLGPERVVELPNYRMISRGRKKGTTDIVLSLDDFEEGKDKNLGLRKKKLKSKANSRVSLRQTLSGLIRLPGH